MSAHSKQPTYRTILDRDEEEAQRLIAVNQAITDSICKNESPIVTPAQRAKNMDLVLRGIEAQRLDAVNTLCKGLHRWGCRQVTHKIFLFRLDRKMWETYVPDKAFPWLGKMPDPSADDAVSREFHEFWSRKSAIADNKVKEEVPDEQQITKKRKRSSSTSTVSAKDLTTASHNPRGSGELTMAGPFGVTSITPVSVPAKVVAAAPKPTVAPTRPTAVPLQLLTTYPAVLEFTNLEKCLISRLYGLRPGEYLEQLPTFIRDRYISRTEMEDIWTRLRSPYGLQKFLGLDCFEIRFPGSQPDFEAIFFGRDGINFFNTDKQSRFAVHWRRILHEDGRYNTDESVTLVGRALHIGVRKEGWRGIERELEDVDFQKDILLLWDALRRICRSVDRQQGVPSSLRVAYFDSINDHEKSAKKIGPRMLTDREAIEWVRLVQHPQENDGVKERLEEVRMAFKTENRILRRCIETLKQGDGSSLAERLALVSDRLSKWEDQHWFHPPNQAVAYILRIIKSHLSESEYILAKDILTERYKQTC